ncbi:hypothetical protein [Streptomyces albireticuli]|uniref:Uncharacterized protein n=1 Tax=Streptomyces albireticuli TaxID=1940 RepID=A0A2A2DA25_9ACTN|nr:hypothetical protein [Streptomyces albireticuli]MCD9193346.1 hypothetical protein [Streptomyces albireticuli]PAU48229.1 hypothetical protein CK936_14310 [Streptomyces albireticuli]
MNPDDAGPLVLAQVRTDEACQWALVTEDALPDQRTAARIATTALDAVPTGREELNSHVQAVMAELEAYSAQRALTPGGASWLHVQHVPVRRLVGRLVRKLLALSAWEPFAQKPGCIIPAAGEALIGTRETSSREYRLYTVAWSGIAYLLDAPAPGDPRRSAQLQQLAVSRAEVSPVPSPVPSTLPQSEVVALSWSSRHAETLLPVLKELARGGHPSVLVDLGTDAADRCPEPATPSIRLCPASAGLLSPAGTVSGLVFTDESPAETIRVRELAVRLDRLERLAASVVETSGGSTQPSWRAVLRAETWLDGVFASTRPHTVLLCNDTSPLGALGVHAAERLGITTVYVQHGAWTPQSVAWPALHSRHIVVMGERDVAPARAWARHPDAEIHVLGQPRFDALAEIDQEQQRCYLDELLAARVDRCPEKIAVWACQPFGPGLLRAQGSLVLEGLRKAEGDWGLIIAPHPAQTAGSFGLFLERASRLPVAAADPGVGARGCLAGADAVLSAYSTCGIEAVLLNIPVLELAHPGGRTLGLADHGLAQRCSSADDIANALSTPPQSQGSRGATDAVCHWHGTSARDIARLVVDRSRTGPA